MKKILTVILCLSAAFVLHAQTSRITVELGALSSHSIKYGTTLSTFSPGATFDLGYAIMGDVGRTSKLGLRTGIGCSYMRNTISTSIFNTFINPAYTGDQLEYTVSANVRYYQRQVNVELPLMFAMTFNTVSLNIGAKAMTTVWNGYEQRLTNPAIAAFFPDLGVTVVNDVSTGVVSDGQMTMKGSLSLPRLNLGLAAELCFAWNVEDEHYLGFCLFADYMPWSFFGETGPRGQVPGSTEDPGTCPRGLITVDPIVNDCEQPKANVTVRPLYDCEGFSMKQLSFGIRFQYMFSIE